MSMAAVAEPVTLLVRVDPEVAEAAVRAVMDGAAAGPEALDAHRARRDPLYAIRDDAARGAAFERTAVAEFEELGLARPIVSAVVERSALAARARLLLVGRAPRRYEEGVTCEPGGEHLGVRLDPARFADPVGLLAWARHALGHAEDTLDPDFAFRTGWEESSGARGAAVAARLHRLWDVTVDARLSARGLLVPAPARRRHLERIAADLPDVPSATVEAVLDRLWDGVRPTYPALVAWAERPADLVRAVAPDDASLPRPDRCPLCGFPGDDVTAPDAATATQVAAEYPSWRPDHGLCGRCTDRFRLTARLGGRP
jgi:hypothetical protein